MIFTITHGQAAVERGFSVNKDVITTNMLERTIISQRMVCDAVSNYSTDGNKLDVSKIPVTKEMLQFCRSARSKYGDYLNEKNATSKKRTLEENVNAVKHKIAQERKLKMNWEATHRRLTSEANDLALKAEKEKKISIITQSNVCRKRALEMEDYITTSASKIEKLDHELKSLYKLK